MRERTWDTKVDVEAKFIHPVGHSCSSRTIHSERANNHYGRTRVYSMVMETSIQSRRDPKTGVPVHEVDIENSDFDRVVLRHDPDDIDRIILGIEKEDSETTHVVLNRTNRQYIGLKLKDDTFGDRRNVPDDILDVLLELGYTVEPELIHDND